MCYGEGIGFLVWWILFLFCIYVVGIFFYFFVIIVGGFLLVFFIFWKLVMNEV